MASRGDTGRGRHRNGDSGVPRADSTTAVHISESSGSLNFYGAHCRASPPERTPPRDRADDTADELLRQLDEIAQHRERKEREMLEKQREMFELKIMWLSRVQEIREKLLQEQKKIEKINTTYRTSRIPFEGLAPKYRAHAAAACEAPSSTTLTNEESKKDEHSAVPPLKIEDCYHVRDIAAGSDDAAAAPRTPKPGKSSKAGWRRERSRTTGSISSDDNASPLRNKGQRKIYIARPSTALVEAACRMAKERKQAKMNVRVTVATKKDDGNKENEETTPPEEAPKTPEAPEAPEAPVPYEPGKWWLY